MSILSLLSVGARMAPAVATYAPRDPSQTVLYTVIADHLETFLASCHDHPEATGFPAYVEREFYDYLRCGILAHGFLRLGCDTCKHELLVQDLVGSVAAGTLQEYKQGNQANRRTPELCCPFVECRRRSSRA